MVLNTMRLRELYVIKREPASSQRRDCLSFDTQIWMYCKNLRMFANTLTVL